MENAADNGEEEKGETREPMDVDGGSRSSKLVADLLRRFLGIQQRRAEAYAKLRRGFGEYMNNGRDLAYQELCREITGEFNDCSKQVIEMESILLQPDYCRSDLAELLKVVQTQEKQKLHLTAQLQILKKAGRPSERLVSHEHCSFDQGAKHKCINVKEITEAAGTEDAEADAEYENALKEAIKGVQDAVTIINDQLEDVRYEIEALESE